MGGMDQLTKGDGSASAMMEQDRLRLYRTYQDKIAECDREIERQLERFEDRSDGEPPAENAGKRTGVAGGAPKRVLNPFLIRIREFLDLCPTACGKVSRAARRWHWVTLNLPNSISVFGLISVVLSGSHN